MQEEPPKPVRPFLPTSRLETLADGIFAIAMTLLVLSIEVPALPGNPSSTLISEYVLSTLIPQIAIYILSFILLAVFWMTHHIFFIIKRINTTLLWINILWLMSIAIVPFSTSMMGKYGGIQLSQLIFDLNMLVIGILSFVNWHYASGKGMISPKVMPYADKIKYSFLTLPLLSVLAIIISFLIPYGSIFVFILIPAIFTLYTLSKRLKVKNKG
jgi:uncharacterized membrane protein